VNPEHLEAVTNIYNERHKKVMKLSMEKARVIRQLSEWGCHPGDIAHAFRVQKTLVVAVIKGKVWREVAG
jgi:hypothetical protein